METVKSTAEGKVILHNVSWETYERLLADHVDGSGPRFAYDRGEMEIMRPSPEHEKINRRMAQLALAVAEALRRSRCSLTVPSGESERLAFTRHRGIAFEAARSSLSRTSAS